MEKAALSTHELTDDEIATYLAHKAELEEVLAKHHGGVAMFADRSPVGTGLRNLGATCYMNSLLQALYMTVPFRRRLYSWKHDPDMHGPSEQCIPYQLQVLFARLQLSHQQAVDPSNVTQSFGWSAADACRQQDVQELLVVLFDAMSRLPLAEGDTDGPLTSMFQGQLVDSLVSKDCDHSRIRKDKTLDVKVSIAGMGTIETALACFTGKELLEGGNQWRCGACSKKVDAFKRLSFEPKALPSVLVVQLERFTFDFTLLRRVKLNDDFRFGRTLSLEHFLHDEKSVDAPLYEVYAIMIHHGTAYGGHYFAMIKLPGPDGQWVEVNDRAVIPIEEKDMEAFFGKHGVEAAKPAAAGAGEAEATTPGDAGGAATEAVTVEPEGLSRAEAAISTNAYILLYRKVEEAAEWKEPAPPAHLVEQVATENAEFDRLKGLYDVRRRMVEMIVFEDHLTQRRNVTISVPGGMSLHDATMVAYNATYTDEPAPAEEATRPASPTGGEDLMALAAEVASGAPASRREKPAFENVRLRRYNPMSAMRLDTYTGREGDRVDSLFQFEGTMAILETRQPGTEWKEYDPDGLAIRIARWNPETCETYEDQSMNSLVYVEGGKKDGTLEQLKASIAAAIGMPMPLQRIIELSDRSARVLAGDDLRLVKDLHVWPGSELVLEMKGDPSEPEDDAHSTVVTEWNAKRATITIEFNKSTLGTNDGTASDGGDGEFDGSMVVSVHDKVVDVKAAIAEEMGRDVNDFHVRNRPGGEQIKDTEQTLYELNITDGGILFMCEGAPLAPDEFLLKVYVYKPTSKPRLQFLLNVPSPDESKIGSLRRKIAQGIPTHSAERIRLRVKSGAAMGKVLRDDVSLRASFSALSDGTEIAVQLLDEPEHITIKDMLLSVRCWMPRRGLLLRKQDIIVRKTIKYQQFCSLMAEKFSIGQAQKSDESKDDSASAADAEAVVDVNSISVAKWTKFRGPLNKSTVGQLPWQAQVAADASLGKAPLTIRDGAVCVVRDEFDFQALLKEDPSLVAKLAPPAPARSKAGFRGRVAREGAGIKIHTAFDRR